MKIIFFGTPDFVIPILDVLAINFSLAAVVTAPGSAIAQACQTSGIQAKILLPDKLDEKLTAKIVDLEPDLFVVAAYGKIIPKSILKLAKKGALNLHPSALPKYRGASPIQSAILHGEKTTAMTIIKMDEQVDHGPIVFVKSFELSEQDTFESLSNKMFCETAHLLTTVIADFAGGKLKLLSQDDEKASFCKVLKKSDGYFDIANPPSMENLDRMIRAFYPWPGVWTIWNEKSVKFLPSGLVQIEGKKPAKLADFLHGYPNFPIKNLKF